jgi:hypothetical protein
MLLIDEKRLISLFKKYESFKKLFYLGKKIKYEKWKDLPLDENFPTNKILEEKKDKNKCH